MMTDYHIQKNSKRCTKTGRELQTGEHYFSVLLEEGGKFIRQDYSQEAWTGPPANAFSFWSGRVSEHTEQKRPQFDDELLLDCFNRLEGQNDPNKISFRYVVALLLMRRKRLKFEEAVVRDGVEVLVLRPVAGKKRVEVINPQLSEDEILTVQEEVFQVLGWQ